MTALDDNTQFVEAPINFCEAKVTPGWERIHVLDLDSGGLVKDATKVDCLAGIAWRLTSGHKRSHEWSGRYKLLCTPRTLKQFGEIWKFCQ